MSERELRRKWIASVSGVMREWQDGFVLTDEGVDRHGMYEWTLHRFSHGLDRYVVVSLDEPESDEHDAEVSAGASDGLHFTRRLVQAVEGYDPWSLGGLEFHVKNARSLAERLTASDLEQSYPTAIGGSGPGSDVREGV
ncbi:hypothetical protein [Streptomyces sp. NPDC002402]